MKKKKTTAGPEKKQPVVKKKTKKKNSAVKKGNAKRSLISNAWQRKFLLLSEATGQIIYIYNKREQSISWYGEYRKILGYTLKELEGGINRWMGMLHPEDKNFALKRLELAEKKCSAYNIQYRIKTKRKGYITVADKGFFIPDEKGNAFQLIGQVSDITVKDELKEIIKKREKDFLSVINEMPHFIYRINLKGEITFANSAYHNAFGYTADEIVGKTAYDLHPKELADKYFTDDKKVFKNDKTFYTIEENVNKIKGTKEIVEVFKIPLHNDKGRVVGLQGVFWNITENIEAQRNLKNIENNYKEIFDATGEGIFIHDAKTGKILDVNKAASLMLGYTKEEILSMDFDRMCGGESFNYETAIIKIKQASSAGNLTFEWLSRKKDGELLWVEVALQKSKIGGKGRILAVVRDISKRKENEKALFLSHVSINTSKEGVIWFNSEGKIIYVNSAAHDMLKYIKKEIYSLSIAEIEDNSAQNFWNERLTLLKGKGYVNVETVFKDSNNTPIPVDVSFSFYKYEKEEFIFSVVRDVSERKIAEEAIRENEKKYRDMTEFLPQGIFECTLDGRVTYGNKKLYELLEYTEKDVKKGLYMTDPVVPEERQIAMDNISSLLKGKSRTSPEYHMKKKNGDIIPVAIYSYIFQKDGRPAGIRGAVIDMSDRNALEKERKEKTSLFSLLFEKAGDANLLLEGSRIIDCNETAVKNLKADSKESVINLNIWDISPAILSDGSRPYEKVMEKINAAYEKGSLHFEWELCRFDKTIFYVEIVITAIPLKGKWYLHTSWRDITDKKETAQKEKIYYQRLEKLLEIERKILSAQSTEAICRAALKHLRLILDCERASVVLLDKPADKFRLIALDTAIKTSLVEGNNYPLSTSPFVAAEKMEVPLINDMSTALNRTNLDEELMKEGIFSRLSVPIIVNNETKGVLNLSSVTKNNFTEEKISIAQEVAISISLALQHSYFIDQINKQNIELEKRIDDRTSQLRQTISELESFSYSVSHDLRAPLRSIGGFSQALIDDYKDKLDDEGKTLLDRIIMASQRMSDLIDALLMLAKITRSEIKIEPVDLSSIVASAAAELQKHNDVRNNAEFIVQPGITVMGDHRLLRIAVENLMSNAWKFTRDREKTIIEFGKTEIEGKEALFIRDNGVGFDMTYAGKLFGAFQRLHSRDEFEGTGIGLATTRRVILRHNGNIWAESRVNEGAVFYFTIAT